MLSLYKRFDFWGRQWHPTPASLSGESHGQRSLEGYSPWGLEESDTTERHHFHFSLSCIGEGNGNRLQCSCLENPRDGRVWWAAVYEVAQSQTQLKRLSSSSSTHTCTDTHGCKHTQWHACSHTYTCAHTHTHTHSCTSKRCWLGFSKAVAKPDVGYRHL